MNAPATPALVFDSVRDFLARHAPFSAFDAAAFEFMIPRLKLAYFPKDGIVVDRDSRFAPLHIVQTGHVASQGAGLDTLPDRVLTTGECFPVGALTSGAQPTRSYIAVDAHAGVHRGGAAHAMTNGPVKLRMVGKGADRAGSSASMDLTRLRTSVPSALGIMMSRMASSFRPARKASHAASPSGAASPPSPSLPERKWVNSRRAIAGDSGGWPRTIFCSSSTRTSKRSSLSR